MNSKLIGNLTNPIRARIFFEIYAGEQPTAKKLLEKFPDITKTTLYRHLKAMLDAGIIIVAGEKQVRGVTEKSYAVNTDMGADIEHIVENNDGDGYFQLFTQYIMNIMSEFKAYCNSDNINIVGDCSGFSTAPLYATKEEVVEALQKISEIILPLVKNEPAPDRELHNLCTIIIPTKKY